MKKLIEMNQEFLIVCDNKNCDFKIPNETGDPNINIKQYLNTPCPKCGENLLTEKDYLNSLKLLKTINWINKWFSWVTIFTFKRENPTKAVVHTHEKIFVEFK